MMPPGMEGEQIEQALVRFEKSFTFCVTLRLRTPYVLDAKKSFK